MRAPPRCILRSARWPRIHGSPMPLKPEAQRARSDRKRRPRSTPKIAVTLTIAIRTPPHRAPGEVVRRNNKIESIAVRLGMDCRCQRKRGCLGGSIAEAIRSKIALLKCDSSCHSELIVVSSEQKITLVGQPRRGLLQSGGIGFTSMPKA